MIMYRESTATVFYLRKMWYNYLKYICKKVEVLKMSKQIELNDALLLGRGHHKAAYCYPGNPGLCIKIPYETPDYDLKRELMYRKVRRWRGLPSSVLTEYHGTVETNLGIGYVFERMMDYDGKPSVSLEEFLSDKNLGSEKERFVSDLLRQLYRSELAEEIITSDTNPENFYIWQKEPGRYCLRIIDNIGSPAFIPLIYFVPLLARRHVEKYWKRFIREINQRHPHVSFNI